MEHIMIFFEKIINRIRIVLTKLILKLTYSSKLTFGKRIYWRKGLKIIIKNNGKINIGDNCFFNYNCSITCLSNVEIGKNTLFGENVKIYDHNHRFNKKNEYVANQGMSSGYVHIGNNCWIGSNVTILNKTVIGNNCVIGAGCVVSGNIPDNTIVKIDRNSYISENIVYK
ncbi:acyltransferase [Ligilactobacillus salivarius]|uniref:acyltransferase n=1 Tax=Ligilactobacillus salivarius TaxID=1624 RepID=UPI002367D839|nr:acyltransferase [Ligilactobacillus salivarius]